VQFRDYLCCDKGIVKNSVKALYWFEQAAQQGEGNTQKLFLNFNL
jgi:TPR repeat protein